MKILSELNAQISSSTRLKWALAVATPIVVGSAGACLYYYYRNGETSAERAAAEKKAAYLKKLVKKWQANSKTPTNSSQPLNHDRQMTRWQRPTI